MTLKIAPEALVELEFAGLPFHGLAAVNGRWPPQQSGLPRRSLSECQPSPFSLSSPLMALDRRQEKMIMDRVGGQMWRPIARRAGSVIREREDGSLALFDPPPVHEGSAVDQDLVDLGAAGTELPAVLQLEREDLP